MSANFRSCLKWKKIFFSFLSIAWIWHPPSLFLIICWLRDRVDFWQACNRWISSVWHSRFEVVSWECMFWLYIFFWISCSHSHPSKKSGQIGKFEVYDSLSHVYAFKIKRVSRWKKTSQLVTYVRLWLYWLNQWNYFDISFKIDSLSLAPRTGREVVEWYVRSFNIDKSQLFLSKRKIN